MPDPLLPLMYTVGFRYDLCDSSSTLFVLYVGASVSIALSSSVRLLKKVLMMCSLICRSAREQSTETVIGNIRLFDFRRRHESSDGTALAGAA